MVGKNSNSLHDEYVISDAEYGKNGVRLLHVSRDGLKQTARELEVTTRLRLSSQIDYKEGNNRDVVATDSQKNIVYVLAKKYGVSSPEEFAIIVAQFLLEKYPHVTESSVTVVEVPWDRIRMSGIPHNHAFIHNHTAQRWTKITLSRKDPPVLEAGLEGLRVLKTTKSAFEGCYRDEYRTLEDTDDRIFSTVVSARWIYSSHIGVDFDQAWNKVLQSILDKFAGPPENGLLSRSVQNTLYLSCSLVLDSIPQISKIHMSMPNNHYYDLDLSRFPKDMVGTGVNKTVFLPGDKPNGFIQATLQRRGSKL